MRFPPRVDVAVIGVGPTGASLLWSLRTSGLDVVGIEAGPHPLSAVVGYPDGLAFLSHASELEVDGLVLDCFDPASVTREEVLHYYTRLIHQSGASVHCRARLVGIERRVEGGLQLRVQADAGEAFLQARACVITGWYRKRRLAADQQDAGADVEILYGLRNPIELAGECNPVPVIGFGLSGRETAMALMRSGMPVVVVARRESPYLEDFRQHPLTIVTGSRAVVSRAPRLVQGGVAVAGEVLPCGRAVGCLGQEVDPEVCAMLVDFGALTAEEARELARARTGDDVIRQTGTRDGDVILSTVLAERPDLLDRVLHGVDGVYLAGGALHGGGSHSGLSQSLLSAEIVVRSILRRSPPSISSALPAYLNEHRGLRSRGSTGVLHLRPILLRARHAAFEPPRLGPPPVEQGVRPRIGELHFARVAALRERGIDVEDVRELALLCDGSRTIGEILECAEPEERENVQAYLDLLFRAGGLSWC